MAIEVCSEISSVGISPRISFSHDLNQSDLLPSSNCNRDRLDLTLLESDFDFCIGNLLKQDLSSADELFSNGKILPVEIKKSIEFEQNREVSKPNESAHPPDPPRNSISSEKKSLKEFLSASFDADADEKPQSKSFWQFKRSSSLNCESSKSRSLIRSLHFLSRSNSTGSSALNSKHQSNSKDSQRPNLQKQPSITSRKSSASSCSNSSYFANSSSQKPSIRKSFGPNNNNGGNGVRISPLLNLPPPYISKVTVSFFGFGSLFCNGKIKKKKK